MRLRGILPAFVSPLTDGGEVREDAARRLAEHQLASGADGFYLCGATGEGLAMRPRERMKLCEAVIDQVKGRKPVIVHVASMEMETAAALALHAERAGADGIASIPPFYFSYDDDDIYRYYKELARRVKIPVMVYYHPATGATMTAELIGRIYSIENVTAVKWSSGNYYEMMKLRDKTHGEINILNGPDEMLLSGLAAGADGGIGSTYNIMVKEYKRLYTLFTQGRIDEARQTQLQVNRVITVIIKNRVIPCVKYALELLGFDVGNASFPMKRYTPEEKQAIKQELAAAGWPPEGEEPLA